MSAMFVTTFINDSKLKLIVSQHPRGSSRTLSLTLRVVLNSVLVSDYTFGFRTPSSWYF